MKKTYHIVNREEKTAAASIEQFAKANGQFLLPLIELVTEARIAVDEVIGSVGRKTIETILLLSAEQVAGARTPGKASGEILWHGSQNGRVRLADRQLKVKRPRLRHKQNGEVQVPAHTALQENIVARNRSHRILCANLKNPSSFRPSPHPPIEYIGRGGGTNFAVLIS